VCAGETSIGKSNTLGSSFAWETHFHDLQLLSLP